MKFYRDIVEAHPNSKIYDKCWDGYRKVPGKSRGEKGSCEKISNEAYDAWDEFDMWYQFDTTTKKLKQKTWYHAQEREARAADWHDSHDKAMRAHGYFPSKFKKGEYVIKGADGKWIKVYPYADKGMSEELNELSNTDQESYYRFLMAKVKTGRTLSKQEKEFIKTYQFYKMSVAEGSLNEFAPGDGEDDPEDDPYKYPKPESYRRSIDFFGRFEADHFDDEMFDEKTGVFKGYWEDEESRVQIAYFKFDDPTRTGSDDPGIGWYYEPASDGNSNNTSAKPAVDTTAHRKQQELGMIDAFLKSGKKPQPGSQIHSLMKKHGLAEGIDPYRLERLDPQTRRVLTRMADHKEPGSWLSASEAYAMSLGLQYKNRDPRGWEQEVQRYVDLYRQYSGQGVTEGSKYKCTCHPGDPDPDCPVHGLEPMEVGDALDVKEGKPAYNFEVKNITKETQTMSDNSLGYKNTLAVMKAADSSQPATINLGGEPVTLDYPEARFIAGKYKAFLRAGRQEEFFGLMADPAKFDGMMKQLRGLVDKQKNFRGSVPGDRGVPGETQTPWIREGESQYDKSHGSPYDRGGADSWYNRPRRPHKGGVGGDSGERSLDLTPDEIEAYHAGYDDNEKSGGKKQWESVNQGVAEGNLNERASQLLSAQDRNGVITVVVQAPDGTKRSLADENPRYINQWLMKYDLSLPRSIMSKFVENDLKGVAEDVDSPVAGAITRRIMSQRLDLLKQYGPELVVAAIDNVADYVGDVEEIGSSDVSAWVTQVERMLKENPPQAFAESLRLVGKHGEGAKTAKVYKDHEWGEYRVKFYTDGKHEGEEADYHTDDRDDANDTAKSWTTKGEKVAESTYWCRQDKTRKLIPEGYKKTAQGYITKL